MSCIDSLVRVTATFFPKGFAAEFSELEEYTLWKTGLERTTEPLHQSVIRHASPPGTLSVDIDHDCTFIAEDVGIQFDSMHITERPQWDYPISAFDDQVQNIGMADTVGDITWYLQVAEDMRQKQLRPKISKLTGLPQITLDPPKVDPRKPHRVAFITVWTVWSTVDYYGESDYGVELAGRLDLDNITMTAELGEWCPHGVIDKAGGYATRTDGPTTRPRWRDYAERSGYCRQCKKKVPGHPRWETHDS